VRGVGVDADQSYLRPQVVTSAEKKVDVAVLTPIRNAAGHRYRQGFDLVVDLQYGGVGIGKISPRVPHSLVARVESPEHRLATGGGGHIPDTVT
jgi:basic membrane lipoprotein Med (substrate-binding protein (PBP1-ABC) superfamily)